LKLRFMVCSPVIWILAGELTARPMPFLFE
jgi:hypothetical protein